MGKKSKKSKSGFQNRSVSPAELRDAQPIVQPASTFRPEAATIDAMLAVFMGSPEARKLQAADDATRQIRELNIQMRAFEREWDELTVQLSMEERELKGLTEQGGRNATAKQVLKSEAKNAFLNHKEVVSWRAKIEKNFNQWVEGILNAGLASDARYQELEAEGQVIMAQAEKLSAKI